MTADTRKPRYEPFNLTHAPGSSSLFEQTCIRAPTKFGCVGSAASAQRDASVGTSRPACRPNFGCCMLSCFYLLLTLIITPRISETLAESSGCTNGASSSSATDSEKHEKHAISPFMRVNGGGGDVKAAVRAKQRHFSKMQQVRRADNTGKNSEQCESGGGGGGKCKVKRPTAFGHPYARWLAINNCAMAH